LGSNSYGNLGTGNTTNRSSPVQTVAGGTNWKQVQVGKHSAGAIKNDGTLWVWGRNDYGNIGDNTTTHRSSPVQTISGGTNWKEISIKDTQCGAIKTDGTLWMWGFNGQGQLGTNDTTNRSSPVQTVAAGTNWKSVNSGLAATGIYFFDSLDSYPTA
jgi:alpha-tubulin suppressor-like RCC1 family protein